MKKILTLQHYPQTTDHTCGPATLLTFLDYHDKKLYNTLTEKKLSKLLQTCPVVGTSPLQLYQFLQQTGKNFEFIKQSNIIQLQQNIDKEHPSIVLWFDEDEWHWSTVVGYDKSNIILLDPYLQEGIRVIDQQTFERLWSKLSIK